ncbi:hypothetical protein FRC01_013502 [Tulasnella sp. 417]|nr:hypothetical protein FRC01_013502 [Tulasnella sp. 417]
MHLKTSSLLILSPAAIAAVNGMPLEPQTDGLNPTTTTRGNSAELTPDRMTNAQRFAMGLPPLKPKTLRRGTRTRQGRGRGGASMLPVVPRRCNILVEDTDEGTRLGYLKPEINSDGFYGAFQPNQANALEVSFSTPAGEDGWTTGLNLFVENAPDSSKPYLGGGVFYSQDGNQDIGTGTWTFAGIGGSGTTTELGVPPAPVENTANKSGWETAIWTYDTSTQRITAQWVNADGYNPGTHLAYLPERGSYPELSPATIGFTGDTDALKNSQLGGKPVTLTCAPPPPIEGEL